MMIVCNEKLLSPAYREKSILLRHAILLPKTANFATSQTSTDHSIPALAPIIDRFLCRRENKALYSPVYRQKKQRRHD
jgi:hypothetical protein